MEGYSDILRKKADPIWRQIFIHPFFVEMCKGQLPLEKFCYYLKQDYSFLIEYARCLGIASSKAEGIDRMRDFASLLNASLTTELEILMRLGDKLEVPSDELRSAIPSPTNYAYTRHLLFIAYSGTLGELMAAMLPCMWSYQEIGEKLTIQPEIRNHSIYAEWCATYVSTEYVELVNWYKRLVDDYGIRSSPSVKEKMDSNFVVSSKFEYLFWTMAYHEEGWPFGDQI